MNPEVADLEPGEELESAPARTLEDFLHFSVQDIRTMDPNELERFHDELRPYLGKPDKPSGGFAEYIEKLPPAKQRQLADPTIRATFLSGYIEGQLGTLRSRHVIETQKQAEREKVAAIRRRDNAAEHFLNTADKELEANFDAWNVSREISGRPLFPEDEAFVAMIDHQREAARKKGDEFFEMTDRYEVGFAQGLERFQVFGETATMSIKPTSKFDDYAKGVDMIARIQPESGKDEIVLGIDFSISSTEDQLAKKLRRNVDHPIRTTKYGTRDVPAGLDYLPVVLAIDHRRAERVARHEALQAANKTATGGATIMRDSSGALAEYHDAAVFQYAVLEEAVAQLKIQAETLHERGIGESTQAQYATAIEYFESILDKRKSLQALAGLETTAEPEVYRVGDEKFIRSASTETAGAGLLSA